MTPGSKSISKKESPHRDLSTALHFGRVTKGWAALPDREVAEQKPLFITLGGPLAHDSPVDTAGTEAAADMLLDSASMKPILEKAKFPDGSLEPIELLVETSSLGAEALPSRIIAARYGP